MTTRTLDLANVISSDTTFAGDKTFTGDIIPSSPLSHRNLIINGAMQVSQRTTSATDVNGSSGYFTVDRWKHWEATDGIYQSSQYSMSNADQNTTGHSKALKLNVKSGNSDSSLGSTQYAFVGTLIEAQDLQHLRYGTANAKTITLSFWIKSSKTGTYNLSINKFDSTATRIAMEYTINSANTWEQKTITITPTEGSTSLITSSAGAIANDNGIGMEIIWILSVGSTYSGATANTWTTNQNHIGTSNQVNWMDSDSNDLYITGVQLELGDNATPFEHRSYGDELSKCQRYFETGLAGASGGLSNGSGYTGGHVWYKTTKRTQATLTQSNQSYNNVYDYGGGGPDIFLGQNGGGNAINDIHGFIFNATNAGSAVSYKFTYTANSEL